MEHEYLEYYFRCSKCRTVVPPSSLLKEDDVKCRNCDARMEKHYRRLTASASTPIPGRKTIGLPDEGEDTEHGS